MTEVELDAIEARAKAATPAPWKTLAATGDRAPETRQDVGLAGGTYVPGRQLGMIGEVWSERTRGVFDGEAARRDADFIAHAREDVPALVAEVRRLRKSLDSWERTMAEAFNTGDGTYRP